MVKVDLACGNNKKDEFIGIDIYPGHEVDIVHDLLTFPYPFEDNSVDELHCSHFIEHIPHTNTLKDLQDLIKDCTSFEEYKEKLLTYKSLDKFILFLNEVYRILKPGSKITLIAPYYTSVRTYGDPTHVRPIADSTFWYVSKEWREEAGLTQYGIECNFDIKVSYYISADLTLKSEEVRNKAIQHDWNAVEDIVVEMIKK